MQTNYIKTYLTPEEEERIDKEMKNAVYTYETPHGIGLKFNASGKLSYQWELTKEESQEFKKYGNT